MIIKVTDFDGKTYEFVDFYPEEGVTYINEEDDACFSLDLSVPELYFWKDDGEFDMTIKVKKIEIVED